MALAGALCLMVHAVAGFTNKSLRSLVAGLLGADYTSAQMTYDLRRLRLHGLITRLPGTHTYVTTPTACASPPSPPSSVPACSRRSSPPTVRRHPLRSAAPSRPWTALSMTNVTNARLGAAA